MIARISNWSSGRELIHYLFGPGKVHEHLDRRVLTSGIVMGVDEGRELSTGELADLAAALDADEECWETSPSGGHIWHLSLSLALQDHQLTDDQWSEIAHYAVEAIGFEREGLEPAAWVAVAHGTGAKGNQHIHIAASLVRLDGSRVNIWQDRKTLSRVCNECEHTYDLTVVKGRQGKGTSGPNGVMAMADKGRDDEDAKDPS
jgi:hypothetical protein